MGKLALGLLLTALHATTAAPGVAQSPVGSQETPESPVVEIHTLRSIDLVETVSGSQLRVLSTAPMELSSARSEANGLTVSLPRHRPGDLGGLSDLRTSLVSSVTVSEQATPQGPGTVIALRTTEATSFQAFRQGDALWIDIRRQGPQSPPSWTDHGAGRSSQGADGDSPRSLAAPARSDDPAEAERQNRQLSLAVAELVEERSSLQERLESLDAAYRELERQLTETLSGRDREDLGREAELRDLAARLAESRTAEAALQERVVELEALVDAADRERRGENELETARERGLAARVAELAGRIEELDGELQASRREAEVSARRFQELESRLAASEQALQDEQRERRAAELELARLRSESNASHAALLEAQAREEDLEARLSRSGARVEDEAENEAESEASRAAAATPSIEEAPPAGRGPTDPDRGIEPRPTETSSEVASDAGSKPADRGGESPLIAAAPLEDRDSSAAPEGRAADPVDGSAGGPGGASAAMTLIHARLRAEPSTESPVVARILPGTRLSVAETRGGWHRVSVAETSGWVFAAVTRDLSSDAAEPMDGMTTAEVALRGAASREAEVIATLPPGTELLVLGSDPGWSEVLVGVERGWIDTRSLRRALLRSDGGTAARVVAEANLRAGPSALHPAPRIARAGDLGVLVGRSGAWLEIDFGGHRGWLYHSFVELGSGWGGSDQMPETAAGRRVATRARLQLRTGPAPTYATARVLEPGSAVEILSSKGRWLRVEHEDERGWLHSDYVEMTAESDTGAPR